MAIITREEASEVYIIPPHSRSENRIDVNRPTIGVDLSGYKVFTAHSDPNRNEIRQTIAKVARFMTYDNQCQHKRWIIMGDFNTANIPDPPRFPGCFAEKVAPRQMTHPNKKRPGTGTIIDYAIFGGPNSFKGTLQANTKTGDGSSDHWPVEILPK
uniref:Cytolethal distending toxin B n=1 Tax=Scaptomyza pallida TaxID=7300 RepID=A0A565DTL9_9MUSC|nr:cytolethal distending toxin B [Scaptomyza pallida]